jgi:tetratricopeptide (TPR) repeat protein
VAIPLPGLDDLPNGPLREFVMALHDLYDSAGQPAARLISKDIFALPPRFENVSHQTVAATLRGTAVPSWTKIKSIVVALADRGDGADERELDRVFKPLWVAARAMSQARGVADPGDPSAHVDDVPPRPPLGMTRPVTSALAHLERSVSAIRPSEFRRPRPELEPRPPVSPVIGGLPDRDTYFTGRTRLLEQMRTELVGNPHAPLVLHGLSGVGKSQLAREYVERHRFGHRITWWVQAEQVERAQRSLVDLADRLDVRIPQSTDQTIDRLVSHLESQPAAYLLVFDGVTDDEIRRLMPTFGGHVIVTTRDPAWGHDSTVVGIEVPDFTVEEAVAFLRKRDRSLTEDRAAELVRVIGRLPLALEHIAALRRAPGLTWEELLRRLEDPVGDPTSAGALPPYPPGVFASIRLALDEFAAASPVAMLVLELFAWFGSEPVSIALLRQGRAGEVTPALRRALRSPVELSKALQAIQQFGLARLHTDQRIEVQPVTRRALRDILSPDAMQRARRNAHEILAAAAHGRPDDMSTGMHREIAAHVLPTDLIGSDSPTVLRTIYNHVRHRYLAGDYAGACSLAESAVNIWRAADVPEPADELVLHVTHEWANALRALGRYQKARELTADAMSRLRVDPAYGEDHPLTLSMSSSHAFDLRVAGLYEKALAIDRRTLDGYLREYGEHDPRTMNGRHNLAVSLRHVGDFAAAAVVDRDTLEFYRSRHGADDWRTVLSVNALAEDLYGLGRFSEVLDLRTEYAEAIQRTPREPNRGALLFRRTLALAHVGLGQLDAAYEMLDEHYQECTVAFGPDHEYTLVAMVSLANSLRLRGAVDEAYVLASDAVTAYARTFELSSPLTLAAKVNLAAILRARGDRTLARQTDATASEALRDTVGERHPYTVAAMANLATDFALAGEHGSAAARAQSEQAYLTAVEVRGAEHPDTLAIGANYVRDLVVVGEVGAAMTLRDAVKARVRRSLGAGHPIATALAEEGERVECVVEPPSA